MADFYTERGGFALKDDIPDWHKLNGLVEQARWGVVRALRSRARPARSSAWARASSLARNTPRTRASSRACAATWALPTRGPLWRESLVHPAV
jgi:hypothetical protein